MASRLSIPSINPVLYEALSGEFAPECDPDRQHTVGRLVIATFQKGDRNMTMSPMEGFQMDYSPSWAPDSKVTISGKYEAKSLAGNKKRQAQIRFVSVDPAEAEHGHRLAVYDNLDTLEEISIWKTAGEDEPERLPLKSAEDIASARENIAELAALAFQE